MALYLGIPVLKQKLCKSNGAALKDDSVKLEELEGVDVKASELKPESIYKLNYTYCEDLSK